MLYYESDKKSHNSQREKIIIFHQTFNKIKRVDENEMGGVTIYIDNKLSDYFDVLFKMMVNRQLLTLVLKRYSTRGWDSNTSYFLKYAGKDLILIGAISMVGN
jgi:hypothetical protein